MQDSGEPVIDRTREIAALLEDITRLILSFISAADRNTNSITSASNSSSAESTLDRNTLVDRHSPSELQSLFHPDFPAAGIGRPGVRALVANILRYSVNTWDQGFLDKLYSSTNAVGLASDLLLSALNTNVHVYTVSPALTLIEKSTTRALAKLFSLKGSHAGGISVQGGSASNTTAIAIARSVLHPATKTHGMSAIHAKGLVLFTSEHGHYSLKKAAMQLGLGSKACVTVPTDSAGRMNAAALNSLIIRSKTEGYMPFFVNATAGTTVYGSFDPIPQISAICDAHHLWLHVDASWGGGVAFSPMLRNKLAGISKANSIAFNPHKMLGVPVTCSFLLTNDIRQFHAANKMEAGYLFHDSSDIAGDREEVWDLADLTFQCGRRADSLKLFLAWNYYGSNGYARAIEHAFAMSRFLAELVDNHENLRLVNGRPPPCLQVCFYYVPNNEASPSSVKTTNVTKEIVKKLVGKGWMVDWAPNRDTGAILRVVVNRETKKAAVEKLVQDIVDVGNDVWQYVF